MRGRRRGRDFCLFLANKTKQKKKLEEKKMGQRQMSAVYTNTQTQPCPHPPGGRTCLRQVVVETAGNERVLSVTTKLTNELR